MTKKKRNTKVVSFFTYPEIVEIHLRQYDLKWSSRNKMARVLLEDTEVEIKVESELEQRKYNYLLKQSYFINELAREFNTVMKINGFIDGEKLKLTFEILKQYLLMIESDLSMLKYDEAGRESATQTEGFVELNEARKRMSSNENLRTALISFRIKEDWWSEIFSQLEGYASVGQYARDVFENGPNIRYVTNSLTQQKIVLQSRVVNNLNQLASVLERLHKNNCFGSGLDYYFQYLRVLRSIEQIYTINQSKLLNTTSQKYLDYEYERTNIVIKINNK
ncbi:hypothetical protein EHJ37_19625 [Vibrio parahaemolyticus]|nr:hypothetical protein [Vibrio parahaemolyticus]